MYASIGLYQCQQELNNNYSLVKKLTLNIYQWIMMFTKNLLLFAIVFSCFSRGQSLHLCSSSTLTKVAVGSESSCDFDEDIPKYSINEIDTVITSCTEVLLCSLTSTLQVERTLNFRDLHTVFFIGVNETTIQCSNNVGIQFMNVTNLTVRQLQFFSCAESFDMYISYRGNYSYPYWSGILIFNCSNIFLENVTVSRSKGIGISVFNTAGTNVFRKCNFEFNGKEKVRGSTGLLLEISNYNDSYQDIKRSIYKLQHCNFTENVAMP